MLIIQGVLDNAGTILRKDGGTFTATRNPHEFQLDFRPLDVSRSFALGTTTFEHNDTTPQPVTVVWPKNAQNKLIFIVPERYGLSFRVEIPTGEERRGPRPARTAKRAKKASKRSRK